MDLRKVKTLIDLVQQSGITELEIQEGEERVRISRGALAAPLAGQAYAPAPMVVQAPPVAAEATQAPVEEQHAAEGFVLKSPMVGTFYRAVTPGGKPLVEVGDSVKVETHVCIIEAMKLLNEIEAGHAGVVKEILVENGQPVEYGQPLMVIA